MNKKQLKPEYTGKLIFAVPGSGKTTCANNITIFDEDWLIENAGKKFENWEEIKHNPKQFYKETLQICKTVSTVVTQLIQQGKTVLCRNLTFLPKCDLIVYGISPEELNRRTSNKNRNIIIDNIDFHIKVYKFLQKYLNIKPSIQLTENEYLSDILFQ